MGGGSGISRGCDLRTLKKARGSSRTFLLKQHRCSLCGRPGGWLNYRADGAITTRKSCSSILVMRMRYGRQLYSGQIFNQNICYSLFVNGLSPDFHFRTQPCIPYRIDALSIG